jgi:hypothetical protein
MEVAAEAALLQPPWSKSCAAIRISICMARQMRLWGHEIEEDEYGLNVEYGYWNDEGWWPVNNWMVHASSEAG